MIYLKKQVRECGNFALAAECETVEEASFVVQIIEEVGTGSDLHAEEFSKSVLRGKRKDIGAYSSVFDLPLGEILVAERGIRLGDKVRLALDWLKVGAVDDEILPPEWADAEDEAAVLDRPDDGFSVEKRESDPPKVVRLPPPEPMKPPKMIPPSKRQKLYKPEEEPGDPELAKEKSEVHYGWLDGMGFYKDEIQNGWRVVFRNHHNPGLSVYFFALRTEVRIEKKNSMGGWETAMFCNIKGKTVAKKALIAKIGDYVRLMSESKSNE